MKGITCSFCGTTEPSDKAKNRFVAGANVFICRGCVEICASVLASSDLKWRDELIAKLQQPLPDNVLRREKKQE